MVGINRRAPGQTGQVAANWSALLFRHQPSREHIACPGSVWRRPLGSTSPKAPRCRSKAGSRPQAGRIGRVPSGESKYRTEIVARDLLLLGAGKQRRRPPTSKAQRESGPAFLRWLRRNCGPGYSILKRLGDSWTSLRAYADRLNALVTPAGRTRRSAVDTSANFERVKIRRSSQSAGYM